MNKVIIFKQRSQKKSMWFFVIYCILILIAAIFIGTGKLGILDFINSHSTKLVGIIAGIVCIVPVIPIIKLTKRDIKISISSDTIEIQDKKRLEIPISEIEKLVLNEPRVNTLNIYSKNKLLYCFDTGNGEESIMEIVDAICHLATFETTKRKRKIIGGEIDIIEYTKI